MTTEATPLVHNAEIRLDWLTATPCHHPGRPHCLGPQCPVFRFRNPQEAKGTVETYTHLMQDDVPELRGQTLVRENDAVWKLLHTLLPTLTFPRPAGEEWVETLRYVGEPSDEDSNPNRIFFVCRYQRLIPSSDRYGYCGLAPSPYR